LAALFPISVANSSEARFTSSITSVFPSIKSYKAAIFTVLDVITGVKSATADPIVRISP